MKKIAISAESTIDLTPELLKEFDIHTVPFTVLLGDKTALDGQIETSEIFDFVEENDVLPKTSAVNNFQYQQHFESLLKEYDAVIHISLSSEMSSAFQNARNVASEMKNVFVIDSRSLSTGIALLAMYASDLVKQGKEPEIIVEEVIKRIPSLQVSFVINTLDYLYKGGRCSAVKRFGATILRIKPQIIVEEGKMIPGKNFIGKNSAVVRSYCETVLEDNNTPDLTRVFITYTSASEDMLNAAFEALSAKGFKNIYKTTAGATIASHCGPKCLGILYINDGNK